MRTMRLNTKLIGAFMIMGLIILIGGLWGPIGISQLGGELREVTEVHFPAIYNLGTIIEAQEEYPKVHTIAADPGVLRQ